MENPLSGVKIYHSKKNCCKVKHFMRKHYCSIRGQSDAVSH